MSASASSPELINQASGQAALMLIESLFLQLVERKLVSAEDLAETIQTVIDAKRQLIADGLEQEVAQCALGLMATVHNSVLAARVSAADGADGS
jgi:hypothetical protein